MASRCGCAAACNCIVQARGGNNGTCGITVTGNGSTAAPYEICANNGLTVRDTPSVAMEVVDGNGSAADPWIIESEVVYAADEPGAPNCARPGADGGIYVPCPVDPANEGIVGDGAGTTTTGNGSPGDPFRVNANIGCGLVQEPVDGNDDPTPGSTTRVAVSGTWPLQGHWDNQNGMAFPSDFPASPSFPGDYDLLCNDLGGAPIYCDSNGELRTLPEHRFVNASGGIGQGGTNNERRIPNNNTDVVILTGPVVTITNPSDCRYMRIERHEHVDFNIEWDNPGNINLTRESSIDGAPFAGSEGKRFTERGAPNRNDAIGLGRYLGITQVVVAPGDTYTLQTRAVASRTPNPGGVGPMVGAANVQTRLIGQTV